MAWPQGVVGAVVARESIEFAVGVPPGAGVVLGSAPRPVVVGRHLPSPFPIALFSFFPLPSPLSLSPSLSLSLSFQWRCRGHFGRDAGRRGNRGLGAASDCPIGGCPWSPGRAQCPWCGRDGGGTTRVPCQRRRARGRRGGSVTGERWGKICRGPPQALSAQ